MKDNTRALIAINQAMKAIDTALAKGDAPDSGPASIDQLQMIRHELSFMCRDLDSQEFLHQEEASRRIGPIIIDSWPLDSELGDVLLSAENEYIKCVTTRKRQTTDRRGWM